MKTRLNLIKVCFHKIYTIFKLNLHNKRLTQFKKKKIEKRDRQ
jgi:hypothetical protein